LNSFLFVGDTLEFSKTIPAASLPHRGQLN
jgi:hypothetical protein